MASGRMKRCLISLIVQDTQIPTPVRHQLTTSQNGYYQEDKKQQGLARMWRKQNRHALLGGMQTGGKHSGKHYGGSSENYW